MFLGSFEIFWDSLSIRMSRICFLLFTKFIYICCLETDESPIDFIIFHHQSRGFFCLRSSRAPASVAPTAPTAPAVQRLFRQALRRSLSGGTHVSSARDRDHFERPDLFPWAHNDEAFFVSCWNLHFWVMRFFIALKIEICQISIDISYLMMVVWLRDMFLCILCWWTWCWASGWNQPKISQVLVPPRISPPNCWNRSEPIGFLSIMTIQKIGKNMKKHKTPSLFHEFSIELFPKNFQRVSPGKFDQKIEVRLLWWRSAELPRIRGGVGDHDPWDGGGE